MKARWLAMLGVLWGALLGAGGAHAQDVAEPELAPGQAVNEAPDPTRLDVARLPPEAVEITRELYAHGLFLEAQIGSLTFIGDANKVSRPGPRVAIACGYELLSWLSVLLELEGSIHRTDNRPPPRATAYELLGAAAGVKLSVPFNARVAIWLDGLVGINWASGDVLHALGFDDAFKLGINYGGELGFDWHMKSRHHSIGLLAGARLYPSLARDEFTIGTYGSGYLRYVF